ncbi:hypothetical protein ACOME3_002877 [Neoechinorhynchus agilis]
MDEENPVELRIYDQFSEIRESISIPDGTALVVFHQDDYERIIPDSVNLEVSKGRVSVSISRQDHSFEGEKIFVRNERLGISKEAILVDDEECLVQDTETKRYYYAHHSELEFKSAPMKNVVRVAFNIHDPSVKEGILSYLDEKIKWRPKYSLYVDENENRAEIKCWAVISNPSQHSYRISNAELFGGDATFQQAHQYESNLCSLQLDCSRSAHIDIGEQKEIGGLLQYTISKPFVLRPRCDLYEEFLEAKITPQFWSSLETMNDDRQELKFTRFYEISSSEFLPTGQMTIRAQGRIVANIRLEQLPAGAKREIKIGEDSSGLMRRTVSEFKKRGRTTISNIRFEIKNLRQRPWEYRFKECQDQYGTKHTYSFLGETDPNVSICGNEIRIVKKLKANESYTITVRLKAHKKGKGIFGVL